MYHDLSYPQDCDGSVWLAFGLEDGGGCRGVSLKIEELE